MNFFCEINIFLVTVLFSTMAPYCCVAMEKKEINREQSKKLEDYSNKPWLDLQKSDFYFGEGEEKLPINEQTNELKYLIDAYQKLDKSGRSIREIFVPFLSSELWKKDDFDKKWKQTKEDIEKKICTNSYFSSGIFKEFMSKLNGVSGLTFLSDITKPREDAVAILRQEPFIAIRIQHLVSIEKTARKLLKQAKFLDRKKDVLEAIEKRAITKTLYLIKILQWPKEQERRMFNLPHKQTGVVKALHPFFMTASTVDPYFRETDLFGKWKKLLEMDKFAITPRYLLWLEDLDDSEMIKMEQAKGFLIPLKDKLVIMENGICKTKKFTQHIIDGTEQKNIYAQVGDGVYLFAMGQNEKLYILPSDSAIDRVDYKKMKIDEDKWENDNRKIKKYCATTYKKTGQIRHDRILQGRNVLCAGTVAFKNGKIICIANDSGHYQPQNPLLRKVIEILKKASVCDTNMKIEFIGNEFKEDASKKQ